MDFGIRAFHAGSIAAARPSDGCNAAFLMRALDRRTGVLRFVVLPLKLSLWILVLVPLALWDALLAVAFAVAATIAR